MLIVEICYLDHNRLEVSQIGMLEPYNIFQIILMPEEWQIIRTTDNGQCDRICSFPLYLHSTMYDLLFDKLLSKIKSAYQLIVLLNGSILALSSICMSR